MIIYNFEARSFIHKAKFALLQIYNIEGRICQNGFFL